MHQLNNEMDINNLAKSTSATSNMQRYYLACIEEFGEDLQGFIQELVNIAYDAGYDDGEEHQHTFGHDL